VEAAAPAAAWRVEAAAPSRRPSRRVAGDLEAGVAAVAYSRRVRGVLPSWSRVACVELRRVRACVARLGWAGRWAAPRAES
jgi:hypothetical protein